MNPFDFMIQAIDLIKQLDTKQEYKEKLIDTMFRIMADAVADSIVAENEGRTSTTRASYGEE